MWRGRYSHFALGALALAAVLALAVFAYAKRPAHVSDEPWHKLASKVDSSGYAATYVDSLRTARGATLQKGLRAIDSPLLHTRERLVLEAHWGPFKAGYGVFDTAPDSASGTAQLSLIGVTTRFVSSMFRVQDYIRSTVDLEGLYPHFFEEHIREGRYKTKRWFIFDHANGVVHSNKKKYRKKESPPFSLDFLSILTYIRTQPLDPGDTFTVIAYVHGKNHPVAVKCVKRDEVRTPAGKFKCVMVEPTLVGSGRISRRDRLRLYLTDDERHMLVRVKAKIKVGSVDAQLIHYEVDSGPSDTPEE